MTLAEDDFFSTTRPARSQRFRTSRYPGFRSLGVEPTIVPPVDAAPPPAPAPTARDAFAAAPIAPPADPRRFDEEAAEGSEPDLGNPVGSPAGFPDSFGDFDLGLDLGIERGGTLDGILGFVDDAAPIASGILGAINPVAGLAVRGLGALASGLRPDPAPEEVAPVVPEDPVVASLAPTARPAAASTPAPTFGSGAGSFSDGFDTGGFTDPTFGGSGADPDLDPFGGGRTDPGNLSFGSGAGSFSGGYDMGAVTDPTFGGVGAGATGFETGVGLGNAGSGSRSAGGGNFSFGESGMFGGTGTGSHDASSACYITNAVMECVPGSTDDGPELETMRWYRDNVLAKSPVGQAALSQYYTQAPGIVETLNQRPDGRAVYQSLYERFLAPAVQAIQSGDYAKAFQLYTMLTHTAARFAGSAATQGVRPRNVNVPVTPSGYPPDQKGGGGGGSSNVKPSPARGKGAESVPVSAVAFQQRNGAARRAMKNARI